VYVLAKYRLCFINPDNEVPIGSWEAYTHFKYILSTRFHHNIICCLVFLVFLIQQTSQSVCCVFIPTPAIYLVKHFILDCTVLMNLKFYLNLISNNTMMVCGGSGDPHSRTFNCFTTRGVWKVFSPTRKETS